MGPEKRTRAIMPKACHNCRMRKVRCNRVIPCSNCVSSGLGCVPGVRSAVQLGQVTNSSGEDEHRCLRERLLALEQAVEQLSRQNISDHTQRAVSHDSEGTMSTPDPLECRTSLSEGDSSFGRQILLASKVATLTGVSQMQPVQRELANLLVMAEDQAAPQTLGHLYTPKAHPETVRPVIKLPPSSFALQLLRSLREKESVFFLFYGFHDRAQVETLCQRVYFPIESLSASEATLFNGILCSILREGSFFQSSGLREEELSNMRVLCEANFQAGLETFEVLAIPTHENAMILSLAMAHAQSEAKLLFQHSLTSAAARHCLALGYHRESRLSLLPSLEAERARRLFWHIYTSDKSLCLRLGLPSTIPDYDIDARSCSISRNPSQAPWDIVVVKFAELSRIQGQIYESLFSAAARTLTVSQRHSTVSRLSVCLAQWHQEWTQIDSKDAYNKYLFTSTFGPVEVLYFSVLTLLHRGETSSNSADHISQACLDGAYQALRAHLAYHRNISILGVKALYPYAVCIFYYTPFTPFVVMFLHCVANSDEDDIKLLNDALVALEQVSPKFEHCQRQLKLCKGLYKIAETFIKCQHEMGGKKELEPATSCLLPLQSPVSERRSQLTVRGHSVDLSNAFLEDLEILDVDQMSFLLDNQIGN
ncbi:hypothetical protein BGZ61DRAFT_457083 [Ilyonectria robusta]|uniref:uncharacterized protein n=1 Tax=Ilyonectria robusta TaxID=1079257 RepID=UPI001E8EA546|nr:uncharacterized protein BGZ61DRAFT_457083 [Ilyonectria robusta]KAH8679357.1 hypothetical protein BGZ61DRAFT_457083 [Ilyonectria robusta]